MDNVYLMLAEIVEDIHEERDMCLMLAARMAVALGYVAYVRTHGEHSDFWQTDWTEDAVVLEPPSGTVEWDITLGYTYWFAFLPTRDGKAEPIADTERRRRIFDSGVPLDRKG